jgi:hypothetical protein
MNGCNGHFGGFQHWDVPNITDYHLSRKFEDCEQTTSEGLIRLRQLCLTFFSEDAASGPERRLHFVLRSPFHNDPKARMDQAVLEQTVAKELPGLFARIKAGDNVSSTEDHPIHVPIRP